MKTQKIKRYRLGVSRNFPITHPKKGKPTYFIEKIQLSLNLLIEAPELSRYNTFDFRKTRDLFDIGYRYTKEFLAKNQVTENHAR